MNVQQQHGVGTGSIGGNKEQHLQMFLSNYTQITMYKAHSIGWRQPMSTLPTWKGLFVRCQEVSMDCARLAI